MFSLLGKRRGERDDTAANLVSFLIERQFETLKKGSLIALDYAVQIDMLKFHALDVEVGNEWFVNSPNPNHDPNPNISPSPDPIPHLKFKP